MLWRIRCGQEMPSSQLNAMEQQSSRQDENALEKLFAVHFEPVALLDITCCTHNPLRVAVHPPIAKLGVGEDRGFTQEIL